MLARTGPSPCRVLQVPRLSPKASTPGPNHPTCLQFTGFASAAGAQLPALLPEALDQLAPLMLWDNLLAISSTCLFYGLEVIVILAVLRQHGGDSQKAVRPLLHP